MDPQNGFTYTQVPPPETILTGESNEVDGEETVYTERGVGKNGTQSHRPQR